MNERSGKGFKDFLPIVIVVIGACLASLILEGGKIYNWKGWMGTFMGLLFIQLGSFKYFDLPTFVRGFEQYDLPTRYFKQYAQIYPLLECILGMLFLSQWVPVFIDIITIGWMGLGAVGVLQAMRRKEGTPSVASPGLQISVYTLSIIENIGFFLLAILHLL